MSEKPGVVGQADAERAWAAFEELREFARQRKDDAIWEMLDRVERLMEDYTGMTSEGADE